MTDITATSETTARPVKFRGGGFAPQKVRFVGPLVFVVLIALAELGTRTGFISNLTLPRPSAVLETFVQLYQTGLLWEHLIPSMQRLVIGASLGASVGIAWTRDSAVGTELFTKADIALYEAKAAGRGCVLMFQPEMELRVRERKALLSDLSRAAENGELELAYQPLLDTVSGRTAGFEALLRWQHPTRGRVLPENFIPLAEESGLMPSIGEWALRAACADAQDWPAHLSVSVNISTRQLADPRFVEKVRAALGDTGFDHRRLEFEVTESALLRDANLPILQEIGDLGIRISLDDFGTGFSSLSYLQRFQFSKIKIDRSFIANAPHDPKSKAIVRTVVELARTLGMQVTAEGVETAEQFDWVAQNCDQAQGYYCGRPIPTAEIPSFLAKEGAIVPVKPPRRRLA